MFYPYQGYAQIAVWFKPGSGGVLKYECRMFKCRSSLKRSMLSQDIGEEIKAPDKGVWGRIRDVFRKPRVFIISDLHLDHTNIIKYCKRPFSNAAAMNRALVSNWNNTIRNKDTVYYLGDLAFGRGSRSTDFWIKRLNGRIFFIKGNHDKSDKIKFHDNHILEHKGHRIFLIHDPEQVPKDWDGWVIHGHLHNNKCVLGKCPFIDRKKKRINVSVELTGYRPVDMDELIKEIELS